MLGIEFAPLILPWERRMQTIAVLYFIFEFLPVGLAALYILIRLLFTSYYPISLAYFAWYIYDYDRCNVGGRINHWMRQSYFWKHYANYFPIKLIKTVDLSPEKNYICGVHPHGILCMGIFGATGTEGAHWSKIFPGMKPRLLTLEAQFRFPVHREIFMASGNLMTSSKSFSLPEILGRFIIDHDFLYLTFFRCLFGK